MKKERMFGKFDIVHTCTSHTDTLWKKEITVDPTDKNAIEKGMEELKEAFRKHAACHPQVFVWTEKPVEKETDNYGIYYKAWGTVNPPKEHTNGNDPELWSSNGILRIVRPVSYARNFL